MMKRRDLLRGVLAGGSWGVLEACAGAGANAPAGGSTPDTSGPARTSPAFDPAVLALADAALGAARDAGASYADIRIADYRTQALRARESRIISVSDDESRGFGVRVIVNG